MGQSAFYGVGGDPMIGTTTRDALEFLDADDPKTQAIAICGEIGGSVLKKMPQNTQRAMSKPVVAFMAGRSVAAG